MIWATSSCSVNIACVYVCEQQGTDLFFGSKLYLIALGIMQVGNVGGNFRVKGETFVFSTDVQTFKLQSHSESFSHPREDNYPA